MSSLQRVFIAIVIVSALGFGIFLYGKSVVQKKWDVDTAKREEVARLADEQNKETRKNEKLQREKDIAAAKSKAGRDAVADWLRTHGVLPAGAQLPNEAGCKIPSERGNDVAPCQCGTGGGSSGVESFAMNCAIDAMALMRWQEACKSNPMTCEVVE